MRPLIACLANFQRGDGGEFAARDVVNRSYTEALVAAGAVPFAVPCLEDEAALGQLLDRADGLLITGGEDVAPALYGQEPNTHLGGVSPWRDRLDQVAVAYALARPDLPVLGICRGIQSLAVFGGGTLYQDVPSQVAGALQHGQKAPGFHGTHALSVVPDSRLASLVGGTHVMVNSFHHQAVHRPPEGFAVTARTSDGVIEALERTSGTFCLGVQFHPELMVNHHPPMAALFQGFVAACVG